VWDLGPRICLAEIGRVAEGSRKLAGDSRNLKNAFKTNQAKSGQAD